MTATTTAPRFYAARAEGRYRVIDGNVIDARQDGDAPGAAYVATCSSRAKAEEKAAALNADAEAARLLDAADRLSAYDPTAAAEDALTAAINRGDEAGADNARAELSTAEERAALDTLVGRPTAKRTLEELAAADAPAAKPAKAEADTQAWRIGKLLREFILARVTPADSELVAHIASRNVCYDGTATLRVTAAWAEELSGFATELENAATGDGSVEAGLRAPSVRAARASRTGLAKLF